mmetsp:Transcript_4537/g.9802  ORF Transcript_4537/g.9802 Transcript_4537/m.9802 type:complete len:439 (+) Transcript_4537:415-1731(+)
MQVELAMLREEKRMYWGTSGSNDADHSGGSSGSDEPSVADSSAEGFVDGEATGGASAFGTTSASTSATGRASTGGGVVANQPRAVSAARTMASPAPVSTAQKERWVKTAHELFALANRCEEDASRWEALVDSHVEFIHPITPYRSFDSSRTRSSTEAGASAANAVAVTATEAATRCMVVGTQALMNDMQSLVVALGALLGTARHAQQPSNYQKDPLSARERTESATSVSSYDREEMAPPTSVSSDDGAEAALPHPQSSTCITTPTCGVDLTHTFGNFYFGESGLMTPFRLATTNLRAQGLACEVSERGMVHLTFEKGRVVRIETSFDTVSCWRQIQHASRAPDLKLTPNLLKAALRPSPDARLVSSGNGNSAAVHDPLLLHTGFSPCLNPLLVPGGARGTAAGLVQAWHYSCELRVGKLDGIRRTGGGGLVARRLVRG